MGLNKRERRERAYGPPGYYEHVTHRPCIAARSGGCYGRIEFCHARSKGAGGDYRDGFPGCTGHHTGRGDSQHRLGMETFNKRHGVNCARVAAMIFAEWEGTDW